jgi:hypothetical protein
MKDFNKIGGYSAIIVGVLSILYAIFYLIISRQSEALGITGSWLILEASGIFSSAAYVGLYGRVRSTNEGLALWALLLGVMASFATLVHGGYEAHVVGQASSLSQVDPNGLATFGVVGLVSLLFSWLVVRGGGLAKNFGYLGIFNALLLIVLYFATVAGSMPIILLSGGLTSVIIGPIWWIWLGLQLIREK